MATSTPPPCRILVRSKQGLEIFTVPERATDAAASTNTNTKDRTFLLKGSTTFQYLSPDGSAAYVQVVGHGIVKVDLTNDTTNTTITSSTPPFLADTKNVQMFHQSPSGAYLLTWERLYEETCPNNLKLWNAATGALVAAFPQKALKREGGPYLQWTPDEQHALLMATNEVKVYPADAFASAVSSTEVRYSDKLRISGISSMSVAPTTAPTVASTSYLFTSFCPGSKDKPARAGLFEYRAGDETATAAPAYPALLSKSLFQAEEMKVHWSPVGDAALITLQTSVDASGESYYGSSQLFLLAASATDVTAVPLPQPGPVHDVAWMPHPDKPPCFVVVAGKMPALASLHHGQSCQPIFLFGNAHRNTIDWAPHGRFLLLAGFGNLAGGMSFWDRNKMKLIPHCAVNANNQLRSEAVVKHGWSPDSRLFSVCTTTPRMNVDNGVRIYRYTGEELPSDSLPWDNAHYRPDKLLEACFVPGTIASVSASASANTYPDRPQSPVSERDTTASVASSAPVAVAAAKPAGRYVPPSARKAGASGMSLAERMRKEKETSNQGAQKVDKKSAVSVTTGRAIPGLAPVDDSKSKSALKREKKKVKDAENLKEQEEAARVVEEEKVKLAAQPATPEELEKRARKIKKTLKQIEGLKGKDASELNEDQKSKVDSEAELLAELASLSF
jgi:translation initiation factor 2A